MCFVNTSSSSRERERLVDDSRRRCTTTTGSVGFISVLDLDSTCTRYVAAGPCPVLTSDEPPRSHDWPPAQSLLVVSHAKLQSRAAEQSSCSVHRVKRKDLLLSSLCRTVEE